MRTILNKWTVMRVARLVLGVIALVMSIFQKDITFGLLAGFLLTTAIANIGCCGRTGCEVDFKTTIKEKEKQL